MDIFNYFKMEIEKSTALLQLMDDEGLMPSQEEEIKRRNAVNKLKKIVMAWASRVAYLRGYSVGFYMAASATIREFGSYGLGIHDCSSDIDALCVGPCFATLEEDFFGTLRTMIESTPGVSKILCIKNGKVPLMRFNLDGIQFDLPYARLNASSILNVTNVLNPIILKNIDDVSSRSISGVVANNRILELIPNITVYQSLVRCVKFWAKKRGIYGFGIGYFGGIHLAVLAALVCRRQPYANLGALVSSFFHTYATWPWPKPVTLEDNLPPKGTVPWRSLMPIHLPGSHEYIWSNVTKSTLDNIRAEFERGDDLTKHYLLPSFDWRPLFEPFCCGKNYESFLKISVSSPHKDELEEWVGWVKSRLRWLLFKLEELPGFCNPDGTTYEDKNLKEPTTIFYWGLDAARSESIDIASTKKEFTRTVLMGRQGALVGGLDLEIVKTFGATETQTKDDNKITVLEVSEVERVSLKLQSLVLKK